MLRKGSTWHWDSRFNAGKALEWWTLEQAEHPSPALPGLLPGNVLPNVTCYLLLVSTEQLVFLPLQAAVDVAETFVSGIPGRDEGEGGPLPAGHNRLL